MRLLPLPFALAVCTHLASQSLDGPHWHTYATPANAAAPQALGNIVAIQTPTDVHFFSGILRRWIVQPVSSTAVLRVTNRYALIQDGNTVHLWSAMSPRVRSLQVSPTAVVNFGSISSSWTCCIVDGAQVWGFSAFFGDLVPLTLQGQLNYQAVNSHTIHVVDDLDAYGFSAFFGTWMSTPTRAGGTYFTSRNCCVALLGSPDEAKAFSAYQGRWTSTALPGASGGFVDGRDGYAVLSVGNEFAFYSTLTGNFLRRTFTSTPLLTNAPNLCLVQEASTYHGYAPGADRYVGLPTPASLYTVQSSFGHIAVIDDGVSLAAFNGLSGRLTPGPTGAFTLSLGDAVALAYAANQAWGYSGVTDQWVPSPGNQVLGVVPSFESMFAQTPTGFDAFSARTATWAPLATGTGQLTTQVQGALTAVVEPSQIHAFDPGLGRWVSQPTNSQATMAVFRLTGIANDGTTGYGYSLLHHTWESVTLNGTPTVQRANSSIGFIQTASHVHVFCGNGSLSNYARYPEFSRFVARGAPLTLVQTGTPGTGVLGLLSVKQIEVNVPGLGILRVDPTAMVTLPATFIPAEGLQRTLLPVPNNPSLNGLTLYVQNLLVPTVGQPKLTNQSAPILW